MKESITAFWPRGWLAGALWAVCQIVPVFVVIMFDAAAGATRMQPDGNGRFTLFRRSRHPITQPKGFFPSLTFCHREGQPHKIEDFPSSIFCFSEVAPTAQTKRG